MSLSSTDASTKMCERSESVSTVVPPPTLLIAVEFHLRDQQILFRFGQLRARRIDGGLRQIHGALFVDWIEFQQQGVLLHAVADVERQFKDCAARFALNVHVEIRRDDAGGI